MLTEEMILEDTDLVAKIKAAGEAEPVGKPMTKEEFLEWLANR